MIRSRSSQPQTSRAALILLVAVVLGLLANPVAALARAPRPAIKTVRYRGAAVTVPASWPVFRLGAASGVCVRFNRHAVYLGRPGRNQRCPKMAIGRTEAILISPASYAGALLAPVSRPEAQTAAGSMLRIVERARHLVLTATWGRDPGAIRRALGLRSLRAAVRATNRRRPVAVRIPIVRPRALARATSPQAPALPGATYSGLGFDV